MLIYATKTNLKKIGASGYGSYYSDLFGTEISETKFQEHWCPQLDSTVALVEFKEKCIIDEQN